ncbi:hypothetical protein ACFWPJ_20110, partial [Nocardia sp. NPDC058497]
AAPGGGGGAHGPPAGVPVHPRHPGPGARGGARGRLRSVCLDVRVSAKAGPPRHGRIDLCAQAGRTEWLAREAETREVVDLREAVS